MVTTSIPFIFQDQLIKYHSKRVFQFKQNCWFLNIPREINSIKHSGNTRALSFKWFFTYEKWFLVWVQKARYIINLNLIGVDSYAGSALTNFIFLLSKEPLNLVCGMKFWLRKCSECWKAFRESTLLQKYVCKSYKDQFKQLLKDSLGFRRAKSAMSPIILTFFEKEPSRDYVELFAYQDVYECTFRNMRLGFMLLIRKQLMNRMHIVPKRKIMSLESLKTRSYADSFFRVLWCCALWVLFAFRNCQEKNEYVLPNWSASYRDI